MIAAAFDARLDILTHMTPVWTVGALAAGAVWWGGGRRGWVTPAASAITLCVAVFLSAPDLVATLSWKARPEQQTIRVVQYNLWAGNKSLAASTRWLLAQDADFLVLQEADGAVPGISSLVGAAYSYSAPCVRAGACPTVILSRRPPVETQAFNASILNPYSGGWARYDLPGGPVTLAAVHLRRPYPLGPQRVELRELVAALEPLPREAMILAGDFNLTPWSFAMKRLDRDLGLQRRTRLLPTWPTPSRPETHGLAPAVLPIDHVYAGKGWRTVRVRRGPDLGSDHYPVVVTLTRDAR